MSILDETDTQPDEPEESEPSQTEPNEIPASAELSPAPEHETSPRADTTAVVPVTALQQYLAEVRRYPYLSKEEELQLFQEYQTHGSREAAVRLIMANLRVSVSIAAEYLHTGADHMDLIQEGNVGLMQAIKKFDPSKNVRFYAYAAWWSRAYILRYLLHTFRLVKVGTTQDQRKLFYNLKKEKAKLERDGFAPDTKLLADRLNVRERDVIEMDQRLGNWELSLDQPIGENQESTLLDVLPSHQEPADEQIADHQLKTLFRAKLAEFITTLEERDEDILRNRILSDSPLTLDDLGDKYGITKERTRQLEARIIKRLRDYMKKDIKDFDHLRA
ncbi:MAG: RNA polymerase factor sigma-32 [Nitrospira sp.]|jgi:RNA polymerase sigma-32 factor|nr:RNA polymerase factor sigma-32 [Nitrospira sp. BO4]